MRRTSVYTLSFDGDVFVVDLAVAVADDYGIVVTGSGTDPRPNVMFRTSGDEAAVSTARLLAFFQNGKRRLKNPTLTTGQGTHTRTINLEGTNMSTKATATTYDVLLLDGTGCGSRARKDAAIKLGNMQDGHFTVVSQPSGKTVHDSRTDGAKGTDETPAEAPAPADTTPAKAPAKATTKKEKPVAKTAKKAAAPAPEVEETEEREGTELEFQGLGKYYARAAGLHGAERVGAVYGVEASISGTTLTLFGSDEDIETVSEQILALWPAAKLAHREYRKNDATYSAISKDRKDKEANAQRWDLEVKWFMAFMDGAADELAGAAKKKGGAYKDGVMAVRNPAPAEDDSDVI
jgi:hypothetical protein